MPFFLIIIGVALGYLDYLGEGNLVAAGTMLKNEMISDNPPFYKWFGAIFIVALLGYIEEMRPIATAMLALIFIAILLSHTSATTNVIKAL